MRRNRTTDTCTTAGAVQVIFSPSSSALGQLLTKVADDDQALGHLGSPYNVVDMRDEISGRYYGKERRAVFRSDIALVLDTPEREHEDQIDEAPVNVKRGRSSNGEVFDENKNPVKKCNTKRYSLQRLFQRGRSFASRPEKVTKQSSKKAGKKEIESNQKETEGSGSNSAHKRTSLTKLVEKMKLKMKNGREHKLSRNHVDERKQSQKSKTTEQQRKERKKTLQKEKALKRAQDIMAGAKIEAVISELTERRTKGRRRDRRFPTRRKHKKPSGGKFKKSLADVLEEETYTYDERNPALRPFSSDWDDSTFVSGWEFGPFISGWNDGVTSKGGPTSRRAEDLLELLPRWNDVKFWLSTAKHGCTSAAQTKCVHGLEEHKMDDYICFDKREDGKEDDDLKIFADDIFEVV